MSAQHESTYLDKPSETDESPTAGAVGTYQHSSEDRLTESKREAVAGSMAKRIELHQMKETASQAGVVSEPCPKVELEPVPRAEVQHQNQARQQAAEVAALDEAQVIIDCSDFRPACLHPFVLILHLCLSFCSFVSCCSELFLLHLPLTFAA